MPVLCLAGLKSCVINYFQPFLWCQSLLPLIWTSDILSSSKIRQKTLCIIQSGIVNDRPCWCFFTLSEPYVCTWCQSWWFSDTPQFKPFEQITPFLLRNTIRAFHCSSMKLSQILPSFSKLVMTFECGTKVKKWLCLLIGTHYLRNSCGRRRRLSQRIKELFVILLKVFALTRFCWIIFDTGAAWGGGQIHRVSGTYTPSAIMVSKSGSFWSSIYTEDISRHWNIGFNSAKKNIQVTRILPSSSIHWRFCTH